MTSLSLIQLIRKEIVDRVIVNCRLYTAYSTLTYECLCIRLRTTQTAIKSTLKVADCLFDNDLGAPPVTLFAIAASHIQSPSWLQVASHVIFYPNHTHLFNGPSPGLPGWACTRKVKPIWILLKQDTVSGSGINWAICKSASRSRQITMPVPHHSSFFTGRMPFLPPNQQRQSLFYPNQSHFIWRLTPVTTVKVWQSIREWQESMDEERTKSS